MQGAPPGWVPVTTPPETAVQALQRARIPAAVVCGLIVARDLSWMAIWWPAMTCSVCGVPVFGNSYGVLNFVLPCISIVGCTLAVVGYWWNGSRVLRISGTTLAAIGAAFPGWFQLAPVGLLLSVVAILLLPYAEPRAARPLGLAPVVAGSPPWQP